MRKKPAPSRPAILVIDDEREVHRVLARAGAQLSRHRGENGGEGG
jgi:hypothetical protein